MINIKVSLLQESDVSIENLHALRKSSFSQWAELGLDTPEASMPLKQFQRYIETVTVIVAQSAETRQLLAMHTWRLNKPKGYASGSNLAVSPVVKHQGIATRMLQEEKIRFRQEGYRYLKGGTAIPAVWSVSWHKKNGYYITGFKRDEKHNYASYTFCKPIALDIYHHPLDILWTRPLAPLTARISYMVSYLVTCLCKTRSGQLTALGRLAKKVRDSRLKA